MRSASPLLMAIALALPACESVPSESTARSGLTVEGPTSAAEVSRAQDAGSAPPSRTIECVGVTKPPTGDLAEDMVGTWVADVQYIDSHVPVIRLTRGGQADLITPPYDGPKWGPGWGEAGPTTWWITPGALNVEGLGRYELRYMNPGTAQFRSDLDRGVTWYRATCRGFGFGDDYEQNEVGCTDAPERCKSLDPPGACLEHSDYWGQLSACGYEEIP